MTLLGETLEAIYRSRRSFRTIHATGVARGEQHRLWVERPARLRAEHHREDGVSTIARADGRWSMWRPEHGGMQGNDEEVSLGDEGALTHLLDPTPLLSIARVHAVEEAEVIGRRAAVVRAVPRNDEDVFEPGWQVPVGGIELTIDLERGIALRAANVALTEVAFDEDLDPSLFVLEFPPGEPPPEPIRVVAPRVVSLSEATSLVSFTILVPEDAMPDGSRLVRCTMPGGDAADGLHLAYVVDPGAVHHFEVSQGPRVAAEEPTAWTDWQALQRDGIELMVREDRGGSWHRAMALVERHGTTAVVSSDLPLETVIAIACALKPAP